MGQPVSSGQGWGEGEAVIRKGLRGRKEVGVTTTVRTWPPILVPPSKGASSWDPATPKAGGALAGAGAAAGIPRIPRTLAEL